MADLVVLIVMSILFPLVVVVATCSALYSQDKELREVSIIPVILMGIALTAFLISSAIEIKRPAIYREAIAAETSQ